MILKNDIAFEFENRYIADCSFANHGSRPGA
jgi:hypothetical protein